MEANIMPRVIIEGTRLTCKSDIAEKLTNNTRFQGPKKYRFHPGVISSEWVTISDKPWGRGLINFYPDEENIAMRGYDAWVNLFERLPMCSWIIDRFHISTSVFQYITHNKTINFNWLERRLKKLNFIIVFCHRSSGTFQSAREDRVKISENPHQYRDLNVYIEEQYLYEEFIKKSIIPSIKVDVSNNNINGAVNKILDWYESNSTLWPNVNKSMG